ncbi:MAG: hypothetical protein US97_C0056G0010 [Microgenomates group bacterium GW2011_GWF1_38_5]|nr:MAG: hypothetical protein US97_C0056G0010 [Microgenomates group bacterium GW2011_GWF1_38_5]
MKQKIIEIIGGCEHDKIREHCLDDVRITKSIYERLNFFV